MKSKLFDVNVYVIDGQVNVIFYKLIYSDSLNGDVVQADTSEAGTAGKIVLNLHSKDYEEVEAIRYALDSQEYDEQPLNYWEEHDEWNTSEWFLQGDTPKIFCDFYDGLEPYEPELGHAWEPIPQPGVPSWSLDLTRRCQCGAEYKVERWRA